MSISTLNLPPITIPTTTRKIPRDSTSTTQTTTSSSNSEQHMITVPSITLSCASSNQSYLAIPSDNCNAYEDSTSSHNSTLCSTSSTTLTPPSTEQGELIILTDSEYDSDDDRDDDDESRNGWWMESSCSPITTTSAHNKADSLTQSDFIIQAPNAVRASLLGNSKCEPLVLMKARSPSRDASAGFFLSPRDGAVPSSTTSGSRPQLADDSSWVSLDSTMDGVTPPVRDCGVHGRFGSMSSSLGFVIRRMGSVDFGGGGFGGGTDVEMSRRRDGSVTASFVDCDKKRVVDWSVEDVKKWVSSLDKKYLHQYADKFARMGVRGSDLMRMSLRYLHNDLMVMNSQHRRHLLNAIHELTG